MSNNICEFCGKAKDSDESGSITQFISTCSCDTNFHSKSSNSATIEICNLCGKRIVGGRKGSITQFIFRLDGCKCETPQVIARKVDRTENHLVTFKDQVSSEEDEQETELALEKDFPTNRYKPLSILGSGAIGEVFLARDRLLKKLVAVKMVHSLDSDQLISFQAEAKATSKLNHPNIIKVLDFGTTDSGSPFMVLEHFDGVSLDLLIKERMKLPWSFIKELIVQITEALSYAHNQGIYHRDLKPSNILIKKLDFKDLEVKLIDFGIAKVKESTHYKADSQHQTIAGTPDYMSPDIPLGYKYSSCSEVYSLGCVMFEALTGAPPFKAVSALEVISMHSLNEPPAISEILEEPIAKEIEKIIYTCLKKEPDERYASMEELRLALDGELEQSEAEVEQDERAEIQQLKLLPIVIFAIIPIALGLILFCFSQLDQPKTKKTSDRSFREVEDRYAMVMKLNDIKADIKPGDKEGAFVMIGVIDGQKEAIAFLKNRLDVLSLKINFNNVKGDTLESLPASLRHLDIVGGGVDDQALKCISRLENLEALSLHSCGGFSNKGLASLNRLNKLTQLNLSRTTLDNEGLKNLTPLKGLQFIDVSSCTKLNGDSLSYLIQFPALSSLSIDHSGIERHSLRDLAKIKKLKYLTMGKIPGGFSRFMEKSSLAGIAIRGNSKVDFKNVMALSRLRSLKNIKLFNCNRMPFSLKDKYQDENPKCKIFEATTQSNDLIFQELRN